MLVVQEGEQEADDHRFDAAFLENFGGRAHFLLVERCIHGAVRRQDPFGNRNAIAPLDQRF